MKLLVSILLMAGSDGGVGKAEGVGPPKMVGGLMILPLKAGDRVPFDGTLFSKDATRINGYTGKNQTTFKSDGGMAMLPPKKKPEPASDSPSVPVATSIGGIAVGVLLERLRKKKTI